MFIFRRLFSSVSPEAMSAARDKAVKEIDGNAVVVFSKSYCPYCKQTKDLLSSYGLKVQPRIIELDQASDGSAIQDALRDMTSQGTVPNIFIAQKHIGGNSDLQALRSQDKLENLLQSAGVL